MTHTVAVFFGGKSTEHDVSIVTALASIIKPLELTKKYRVVPVYISKTGEWYSDNKLKNISLYSSGAIDQLIKKSAPLSVSFRDGLVFIKKTALGRTVEQRIDIAFPALHGTYGEDGSLMGVLRMAGIPFVGCDLEASVVSMNKLLAHEVVSAAGIPSHPYKGVIKQDFITNQASVLQQLSALTYPLFVKPVHLGSSIGITKVANVTGLVEALTVAFHYDEQAIVEEAIPHLIEVTVPVMGPAHTPKPGLVERPIVTQDTVFDFTTKYLSGGKGRKGSAGAKAQGKGAQGYSELPAVLSGTLYAECENLAKQVYSAVGCSGIARIDLLIDSKANVVYFNEINPLPGSLYDHNWRAAGIAPVDLVNTLIEYAVQRAEQQSGLTTNFSTNFLQQF